MVTFERVPVDLGLTGDEALLDHAEPNLRWWIATTRAVVVGLGLHHRAEAIVDVERCRTANVALVPRRAGGGAVLVDEHMLCGAICVPITNVAPDITESYRWLGDLLVSALDVGARRVEVAEARADVAALRAASSSLLDTCYGALSPHEVVIDTTSGAAKLVGLAQIRRRHAALFQFGLLLRDQSPLADYLRLADETSRPRLKLELQRRTIGLPNVTHRSASAVAAAVADAMPFAS